MDILQSPDLALGALPVTLFLGFATIVLMLWYTYKKQSYWKKLGVPYVKPYPLFGSTLESFSKPLHIIEVERLKKYGKIYGHYEGNRAVLSIADPEILRNILVKDLQVFAGRRPLDTGDEIIDNMLSVLKGEEWKRIRTIVTPTFTTGKIKRMMSIFKDCSRTLVQNFKKIAESGKPFEAKSMYGAFTMDIIASSAFSTKIDSHNDPNNEFVENAKKIFTPTLNWRFVLFILMPTLMKIFRIGVFSRKAIKFFSDVTLQIMAERKRTGQKRNDFLQLLIDTTEELIEGGKLDLNEKDDIIENYGKEENSEVLKPTTFTKKTLSHEELISQCVMFFIAGFDATATSLAFLSYNLALHPDCQEKLIAELDDVLRENNGELTYEAIQSMKYLDNVISETLRIYSPAIRIERIAEEDYELGETGLIVPKGMIITIPIYAIHRDPENFPDPEKFDPDRFTPEERAKRNQYAYLPFGAGPRNCVGMRFVLVELKVCLAYVLSNFRIKRCPETTVPLEWHLGPALLQPKDIILSLEVRKDTVKAL